MPHAILKYHNTKFWVDYSIDDNRPVIDCVYFYGDNSQTDLYDYLSESVLDSAYEVALQDWAELQVERAEYEKERNRDSEADNWC